MRSRSTYILTVLVICGIAIGLAFVIRARNGVVRQNVPSSVPPASSQVDVPNTNTASEVFMARSADGVTEVRTTAVTSGTHILLDNPTSISGTTTAFENRISWKVMDDQGTVVSEGGAYVHSPDMGQPGPFLINLFYDAAPKVKTGKLIVYEASAKDGTPIHVVTIPVEFFYGQWAFGGCDQQSVTLFFPQHKRSDVDCERVFPVSRLVCGDPTSNDLIAVHELLKGPTAKEKNMGYFTSLPENVETPTLWWGKTNTLIFDFGPELEAGVAGSCRVQSLRSQLRETLTAQTKSVGTGPYISIQHRIDDILQP